uniref:28S ribosomal protein S30 n=1 Tax=Schistocephalus solidus TaxID=70667 RepID=A0A0X3P0C7_SCHSO
MLKRTGALTFSLSRLLHSSECLQKQPPWSRMRRKRKIVPPAQSLPFCDEDPVGGLKMEEVFPKPVTGVWGSTEESLKRKFFKKEEILKQSPTVFGKLRELYYLEDNMWYNNLDLPLLYLESLEFSQHITRTALHQTTLPPSSQPEEKTTILSQRLSQFLRDELHLLNKPYINTVDMSVEARRQRSSATHEFLCSLMECIHGTLAQLYPNSHLITRNNQIDNGAKVETFFKRTGYADLLNAHTSDSTLAEGLWEPVSEVLLDSDNLIRFRLRGQLNWQLRGQMPLQPFVSTDDPSCFQKYLPSALYRPESFGVEPVENYDFSCLPFTLNKILSEYLRTVAGYWSDTPFFKGDPCQFGLVGVVDTSRNEDLLDDLTTSTLLNAADRELIITRHGLSEGILTAFAWSSAIAYNQGFTLYNDLTYPIPVQLLLTDGHHFQLLRFQLNSLTALWKPEDAGLPFNMAWASQRLALYNQDEVVANDKITINTSALALIINALLREPMKPNEEINLRPYLAMTADNASDSLSQRLIPPSLSEEEQLKMSAGAHGEHLDAHLTPAERKALLATEASASKRTPLRIGNRPQPHPNDIFFLRPTEKTDLMEEFREQMPVFGGRSAALPEPHKQTLLKEKRRIREITPHRKVQRGPRRWR